MRRSTVALLVLTVGLGAYIAFVERFGLSDASLYARRGRVFETFVRDDVARVVIERPGEAPIDLVRRSLDAPELTLEGGAWELRSPVEAGTDFDAVDSLLVAMEYAEDRRRIEGVSDLGPYDLDDPILTARYQVGPVEVPVRFGGTDPQGAGRYLQVGDPSVVFVVGRDLYEAFNHDADHFRSKDIVPRRVARGAVAVSRTGEAPLELTKRDGRWWRTTPRGEEHARGAAVDGLLGNLESLRAARFEDEVPVTNTELRVPWEQDGMEEDASGVFVLGLGGPCSLRDEGADEEADDGRLVVAGSVAACAPRRDVDALEVPVESFFDPHLLDPVGVDATRIELTGSVAGVTLARKEDGAWKLAGAADGAADGAAVGEWLTVLRDLEAARVDARAEGAPSWSPVQVLRVERRRRPAEMVTVGATVGGEVPVRRGDEAVVLWFAEDAISSALDRGPASFRSRELSNVEDAWSSMTEVTVRRGSEAPEERLERTEGEVRVVAPVVAAVDTIRLRGLVERLGALRALAFVADQERPEHGLAAPRFEVRVRFGEEHEHGDEERGDEPGHRTIWLRVGADAPEGGAFAQLQDAPGVFRVDPELVASLEEPFVARGLLQTDTDRIAAIQVGDRELRRAQGGRLGELSLEATATVTEAIAGWTARRVVAYGSGPPGAFDGSRSVAVTRRDGERLVAIIGAPLSEDETYARRGDLEIVFALPRRRVDALFEVLER